MQLAPFWWDFELGFLLKVPGQRRLILGAKSEFSQSSWIVLSLGAFDRAVSADHFHTLGDSIRPVGAEIQAFQNSKT